MTESRTRSGRLLRVIPSIEWYGAGEFERGYRFLPAFRDDVGMAGGNPSDNYGRSSADFEAHLRGPLGSVQFKMSCGWDLEDVEGDWMSRSHRSRFGNPPSGHDLGYHSPTPRAGGQEPMSNCDILGRRCYYDGSGLNADPVLRDLVRQGMPGVWAALEAYYRDTFEETPHAD